MADTPLNQLLSRARRRWTVWRIVESSALGAGGGAIVANLILPILIWQGQPGGEAMGTLLIVGAIVGFCWGILRRPTLLQTAELIDKQLQLHDLFSSTILQQTTADTAFMASVFAVAGERSRSIHPNELILRRLGTQMWGGIGLSTAIAITLTLLSGQPGETRADVEAVAPRNETLQTQRSQNSQNISDNSVILQNNLAGNVAKKAEDRSLTEREEASTNGASAPGNSDHSQGLSADGAGQDRSRTRDATVQLPRPITTDAHPDSASNSASLGGTKPVQADAGIANRSGFGATNNDSIADRSANLQNSISSPGKNQIDPEAIPADYRDLVRQFFSIEK